MSDLRIARNSLVVLAFLSWTGSAKAGLLADSGNVYVMTDQPISVAHGALASNSSAFVFSERQNFTLPTAVTVDATLPGTVSSYGDRTPGTIAAGTDVDSYFIHSNGVGTTEENPSIYDGTLTFSSKILGVIALDGSLDATDSVLGMPGTEYSTGLFGRGLELNPLSDYFSISADGMSISYHMNTGAVMDEFRIIVASSVPEPTSVVLMGLGGLCAIGVATVRRRGGKAA